MDKVEQFAFDSFINNNTYTSVIDEPLLSNMENGRLFSHLLSIDISGDSFEVPIFASHLAVYAKKNDYTEIVLPLFNNADYGLIPRKMAGVILQSFLRTTFLSRLTGIRASNGLVYYGCPGLILDENFNILLMLTVQMSIVGEYGYVSKCICRVPHSVLSRQDELLPKTIYKKIIPLYCTKPINYVKVGTTWQPHMKGKMVEVVLHSSPSIILSPVLPTPKGITDDVFDRILNEELKEQAFEV